MTEQFKEWVKGEDDAEGGYWQEDAPREGVDYVLAQDAEQGNDGRSRWLWIRLPDRDLVLACYPQGETYLATEKWRTI